jgi:cysteine desulfurase/selenocysteine lyase
MRAPRGTGLLYVAKDALGGLAPAVVDNWSAADTDGRPMLRDDARRFENPDMPPALKAGLLVAIEEALDLGLETIAKRIVDLARPIRLGLDGIPGVTCRDLGRSHSGLVSLTIHGVPASQVRATLASGGVMVGANGRAYTPFDMAARDLEEIVRVSPHAYNTGDEVDHLLDRLRDLSAAVRQWAATPLRYSHALEIVSKEPLGTAACQGDER